MSSFHLFDPNKSVRFVKASQASDLSTQNANDKQLNGNEIRKFYEDLISQPSTSTTPIIKKVKVKKEKVEAKVAKQEKPFKAEITERDERLFFKAAELNDVETLIKYLNKGININLRDSFGWNALMCASSAGSLECFEVLLLNGADLKYSTNGTNAETLAKQNNHKNVVNFISKFRTAQAKQQDKEIEVIEELDCQLCGISHFDSNHDTSIAHLVKLNERPDEGYAYGISASNIGYRLLKKAQWAEGSGLGKDKEGRKYPIRTALKRDKKGLGLEKSVAKVTHFESLDPNATRSAKRPPRTYIRQLEKEITKKKAKEIQLRRLLS